jgi:glycosyltransferase involved in cell wall biosynthesis
MQAPLVSIVVPVYNLEFYIERCLDSLANQTLKDIEVIVVNDGGSDDSQLIIDEYVEQFPHIFRAFVKPNGGHGSACNFGIEQAQGQYVTIVDGDDFLDPDTAEFMYHKAVETGADLLIGNLLYQYTDRSAPFKPLPFDGERRLSSSERELLYRNWATPCARLYRRSMFEDPKLRLCEGIIFADTNFAPKTYLVARNIYYVDKELYNYDLTRPTQSMKQTDKRILDIVTSLTDMLEFYREKGAFEQYRAQLQAYTVMHAVAWIAKVGTLHGYDKLTALRKIFAVPEKYFGRAWVKDDIIEEVFGRRRARRMPFDRILNYRSVLLLWQLRGVLQRIDRFIERVLLFPLSAYRRLKGKVWRLAHQL